MNYWDGPARWINTALIVIVSFVGLDTLFRLLGAREQNVIVGAVRWVANIFLFPFADMFEQQHFLMTAIIALVGYGVLTIVTLAIVRAVQASRRDRQRQAARTQGATRHEPFGEGVRRYTDETQQL